MERFSQRSTPAYHPINTAIIARFSELNDDQFELDGELVDIVTLVGKVEAVTEMSLRLEIVVSDEWGRVNAVVYKKPGKPAQGVSGYDLERRGYAMIVGSVKRFTSCIMLVVARISPLTDYRAVLNHRLSVQWTHNLRLKFLQAPLTEKSTNNRIVTPIGPTESTILQAIRDLKPGNTRLMDSEKAALAKDLGLKVTDLDRHVVALTVKGYLSRCPGGVSMSN